MKSRKISPIQALFLMCLFFSWPALAQQAKPSYLTTIEALESKAASAPLGALENYNLGTAYAKLDSLGPARFYLERAHLLKPWNKNINSNIRWLKTELADEVAILPEFAGTRIYRNIALTAAPIFWQLIAALLLLAILIFTGVKLFRRREALLGKHWLLVTGALVLSLICFGFSSSASGQIYGGKRCVVIEAGKGLKEAPEHSSQKLTDLYPGIVVNPLEAVGDWWQVRTEDGTIGWLEKKYVRNISFERTKS